MPNGISISMIISFLSLKKTMTRIAFLLSVFFCGISALIAQVSPARQDSAKQERTKPLELPEFVIEGKAELNIPGGSKRAPRAQAKLSPEQLDRYNGIEKTPPRLANIIALPGQSLPVQEYNGFLRGSVGMFFTPSIDAGMRFTPGDFQLNIAGGGTYSQGHRTNADFMQGYAHITSRYTAPKKYFFFGGSVTESWVKFNTSSYKFFAVGDSAPKRTWNDFSAGITTSGTHENINFEMGARLEASFLNTDTTNVPRISTGVGFPSLPMIYTQSETLLAGSLFAGANTVLGGGWRLGGRVNVQLQSGNFTLSNDPTIVTQSCPLIEALITLSQQSESFSIDGFAGYQTVRDWRRRFLGGTSEATQNNFLKIDFSGEMRFSPTITLRAKVWRGVEQKSMIDVLRSNPYATFRGDVLYSGSWVAPTVNLGTNVELLFHPSRNLQLTLGGGYTDYDYYQTYFLGGVGVAPPGTAFRNSGEFKSDVPQATITQVRAGLLWKFSSDDALNVSVVSQSGKTSTSRFSAGLPYLPTLLVNAEYRREWSQEFSTILSFQYMGERVGTTLIGPGIFLNYNRLPSFADLRLSATWKLKPNVHLFVRGDNLLNQTIFLFDGYQERGIFGSVGVQLLW